MLTSFTREGFIRSVFGWTLSALTNFAELKLPHVVVRPKLLCSFRSVLSSFYFKHHGYAFHTSRFVPLVIYHLALTSFSPAALRGLSALPGWPALQ
jgi:hypothetical protein